MVVVVVVVVMPETRAYLTGQQSTDVWESMWTLVASVFEGGWYEREAEGVYDGNGDKGRMLWKGPRRVVVGMSPTDGSRHDGSAVQRCSSKERRVRRG